MRKPLILSAGRNLARLTTSWSGRGLIALVLLGAAWTWWGTPPPLSNANAPGTVLQDARALVERQANQRRAAVGAAAVLAGPRGDFEQRGIALRDLPADQQPAAARELASDVRRIEQVARTAEAERTALRAYDDALMARTRDLGPLAESLRPATWPIVEHLKLYPPPLGLRFDWIAPNADFFATRALILEDGTVDAQVQAAIEVGRSTYAVQQLRELDATYQRELDRYALALEAQVATTVGSPSLMRVLVAVLLTIALVGLLLFGGSVLTQGTPNWLTVGGIAALLAWYFLPLPLALVGGIAMAGALAARPALIAWLPLAAIPLYYRPRTLGPLSFPLNETLLGWIVVALLLRGGWALRQGGHVRWSALWALLWRERSVLIMAAGLLVVGGLSLLAPPLVDGRVALRELRRTMIEPALWALITSVLLRCNIVRPVQLLWALILPATVVASDGLIRFGLGRGIWATSGVPRLIGILPSSTALGVYLAVALAGAATLALVGELLERRVARLVLGPLVLGVLLTFTRGAWIGVGVALLAVLVIQRRWRIMAALVGSGGAVLLLLALLQPLLLNRVLRLGEGTGTARREIWTAALRAVSDSPLLGLGLDQFSHVDPARYNIPQIRFLTLAHPHNLILDVWLQLGSLGLVVLLTIVGVTIVRLWRLRRNPLALGMLAMLIDLLIHGMLDQTLLGGDLFYVWWMLILGALHLSDQNKERV